MQQVYRTSYRVLHKVSVGFAFNFSGGTNKEAQVTLNNNMGPDEYYNGRITALQDDLKLLTKKRTMLAWLRFAVVTGIIA